MTYTLIHQGLDKSTLMFDIEEVFGQAQRSNRNIQHFLFDYVRFSVRVIIIDKRFVCGKWKLPGERSTGQYCPTRKMMKSNNRHSSYIFYKHVLFTCFEVEVPLFELLQHVNKCRITSTHIKHKNRRAGKYFRGSRQLSA